MSICAIAVLLAATHGSARHTKHAGHVGKSVRPIAVVLNGTRLAVNPPPRFYRNHLLVPVRRIIEALGLQFSRTGSRVTTFAGATEITLTIGSAHALVDGEPVALDAPALEIRNTLYAPLRFFTEALDAQAIFDRQTNSVEITSALLGHGSVMPQGGASEARGTVTAVDLDSNPPTMTLTYIASVHTLPIDTDAQVVVQDVNTGTSNPGELADVHPGDWAQVALDRSGRIKHIIDAYGSRSGTIAAAASGVIVLGDGHVIGPSRATTITLNGSPTTIDRLQVGDTVNVRYNIDTSEPRQIIATRTVATAQATGATLISAISASPQRPLRKGDTLSVTVHGTPGGLAAYDIGPYLTNLPLRESASGVYTGSHRIPGGVNFADAPVLVHLNVRGSEVSASGAQVSVSTVPPGIADFAPGNGATVNNSRPSIYATFAPGVVPVNPSSATIEVNGLDVTGSATRSVRFVDYMPSVDYRDGPVRVTVRVADEAGNMTTKSWLFFIKTR